MKDYLPTENLLKDKVILVTGAGSGIGRTIAITFAQYGASVILLGRTIEKLEAVYDCIKDRGYPLGAILPMDLATEQYSEYEKVIDSIDKEFGKLNGVVHNAGLLGRLGPISQLDPNLWLKVMQVNINARFLLTRAALPLLKKEEYSSIIFTTSNLGIKGRAHWGAYATSKFATEGFMQSLAEEEKDISSLRINIVNPGRVRTPMRRSAYPAEDPMTVAAPESIMPTYLYLMGDASKNITGQRFNAQ